MWTGWGELICRQLARCGYSPFVERVWCEDAMGMALKLGHWDIVLIDHHLPGFTGLAALELLRKTGSRTPVLCITSSVDPNIIGRLREAGAQACLNKNDLSTLCAAVESALSSGSNGRLQRVAGGAAETPPNQLGMGTPFASQVPLAISELAPRNHATSLKIEIAFPDSFAATVAHELRVPLRAIREFTARLQTEHASQWNGEARRLLGRIEEDSGLMTGYIKGLLTLARAEQQRLECEPIDTSELVHQAWQEVCPEVERRRIELKVEPLPKLEGDTGLLRLVFVNLLDNAIKFSARRAHPVVEVRQSLVENQVLILVRDNGVGFDMRETAKLFQPFHRLHPSDQFHGKGLGLATVHRIIQRHGGCLWAEARVNEGAAFYFSIPSRSAGQARAS